MLKRLLILFFQERPAISARQIGILAGYKEGQYFTRYLAAGAKPGQKVPTGMEQRITAVLDQYGFQDWYCDYSDTQDLPEETEKKARKKKDHSYN